MKRGLTAYFGERSSAAERSPKRQERSTRLSTRESMAPLPERMRPHTLDDLVGQDAVIGPGTMLRSAIEKGYLPSLILWGPPGCGKTTMGRVLAESAGCAFVCMSAAGGGGVAEVKRVIEEAAARQRFCCASSGDGGSDANNNAGRTVLFLDEIHRFNKSQQDSLLRAVEDGTIILIGATTENPSFEVNSALLSRCRVVTMHKIEVPHLETIIRRAVANEGAVADDDAVTMIAELCDGDARRALNAVEMLLVTAPVEADSEKGEGGGGEDKTEEQETKKDEKATEMQKKWEQEEEEDKKYMDKMRGKGASPVGDDDGVVIVEDSEEEEKPQQEKAEEAKSKPRRHITAQGVQEALMTRKLLYDRAGEEHYNLVSVLLPHFIHDTHLSVMSCVVVTRRSLPCTRASEGATWTRGCTTLCA